MRIVAEIVPRQTEQWPEGSHNKQLNLTYRKKSPDFGFLGNVIVMLSIVNPLLKESLDGRNYA